ncbi:hypothetical protein C3K47_04040 [Solitalea longa]|uniref:Uncharacterized protein n=1 Tax=Solitalea longa TaxID=2079460 RepID=A0A2S5A7T4_9SPHI|nr:hypothetical protein [Solitalea longa]POY38574.1 hypothetical protein C3K47_04040 [Solitalea longa]
MRQLFKLLALFLFALAVLTVCSKSQLKPNNDIRIVKYPLDNSNGILTFALADGFYIAFDTVQCGLYKVWRGGLAANDSTITAVGDLYYENYLLNSDIKLIDTSGQGYSPVVKFKGFKLSDNTIKLFYQVTDEDIEFTLEESIDGESEKSAYNLHRNYISNNLPDNTRIGIYIPNSSIRKPLTIDAIKGEVASGIDKLLLPQKGKSKFILSFSE